MSGIEIAGLVLAVIPLFIAAAEHIQGNTKSRKAIKDAAFAGSYKLKLTQQHTLLGLYIKGIVGRTSLPASTQADLVDDLRGEIWERPEVVRAITQELGDANTTFVELLTRSCSTLALCLKEYQREKSSELDIVDLLKNISLESKEAAGSEEKKSRLWNKIKLSVKPSDGKVLLSQLDECNQMLERLSRAAFQAKPYEKTQQARRAHLTFKQRDDAERLFYILRKACSCENGIPGRSIALRLQAPPGSDNLESKFQMLLFDSQHAICELSANLSKLEGPEPAKKKARIDLSAVKLDTTLDLKSKNMKILGEICNEAKQAVANNSRLHIFVDEKEAVYSRHAKSTLGQRTSAPELLSLASVMSKLHVYEHKKWLHREKSILAVTLAYSLLRLHQSPWLQAQWDSNSISFIDEESGQPNERFKLQRPFTRSQGPIGEPCCLSGDGKTKPVRPNAHLHALGVVLLELYLNHSIEADVQAQIETYGSADYRGVAIDLLEDHADDMAMTIEYNRATHFCLSPHPNPYSGSFSFEDQGFREIFYNEVIVNLEDNLRARFECTDLEMYS